MTHPAAVAALREAIKRRQADAELPSIEAARADANALCEYAFTDQTQQPLKQAWHHREWQRLTEEHDRLVMWFPIEHGKTTQAKMTVCRLLGQHPDRQYAYVSSKATQAYKTVGAIKREIEGNERLRRAYPGLKPQQSQLTRALEEWGNTRLRVEGCPPGSKDPSLAAYGLDGQILGSRLHGAILDNILDKQNTASDGQRRKVLELIEDEIVGRILPGGFIWIIDTAWYEDDALHQLARRTGWHAVRFDAHEGQVEGQPLWPQRWPWTRLDAMRKQIGPTAYDRQFRNKSLSETMAFFKRSAWDLSRGRCAWRSHLPDAGPLPEQLRTGVDLATRKGQEHDLTALATASAIGARRQLLHLEADRIEGFEILSRIVAVFRALHLPVIRAGGDAQFVVEDNAAQVYLVQLMRQAEILRSLGLTSEEASAIRIVGRTTTAQKRDPELGVQGLATELEMDRWDFPLHAETDALWEEMRVWAPSAGHYGDRLMALWFASSSLLQGMREFRCEFV